QREWLVDSPAAVRVVVRDRQRGEPVAGARVRLWLTAERGQRVADLLRAKTDRQGTLQAQFHVPAWPPGEARLHLSAETPLGTDFLSVPVTLKRGQQILLTTDKPIYQPEQHIYIRTLTLRRPDLKPVANRPLTIEVFDARGNKVFKKTQETSLFGVAAAEFQLAEEVNFGPYRIRATLGEKETRAEKTVRVEKYVLPKFKITVETDRAYYLPGETVRGTVQAEYFFGKPVSGGKVAIAAKTQEVGEGEFARLSGRTDAEGRYEFEQALPQTLIGQLARGGTAEVQLEVTVTDGAQHRETTVHSLTVAAQPLTLNAIPESGTVVPGVENKVYLLTTTPDGSPVQAKFEVTGGGARLAQGETDELGVGEWKMTPTGGTLTFTVQARDRQGREASRTFTFQAEEGPEALLLRPSHALAKVGDQLRLEVLSTRSRGTVYLDAVKDRQTMLTAAVQLHQGRGAMALTLPPELAGTVAFHAYTLLPDGEVLGDVRLVYVDAADELRVEVTSDRGEELAYAPGERAQVHFRVTDTAGKPTLAALGVQVVDESVFALSEMRPGLAKVYFTLAQELLEPKVEIHGCGPEEIVLSQTPQPRPELGGAKASASRRRRAAQVLFAAASQVAEFSLRANSYEERRRRFREKWLPIVQRDAEQIQRALEGYFRRHPLPPPTRPYQLPAVALADLQAEGLLTAADLRDPWGRNYLFRPGEGRTFVLVELTSLGPDGQPGTDDDLTVQVEPSQVQEPLLGLLWRDRWFRSRLMEGPFQMPVSEGMFVPGDAWEIPAAPPAPFLAAEAPAPARVMVAELAAPAARLDRVTAMPASLGKGGADFVGQPEERTPPPAQPEPPRVRQFFPETLFNAPALITDSYGRATVDIPLADSITTWRLTALASSLQGQLGSVAHPLRVFQDFFLDLDLPVALTQGDEVSIPVAVYNYLPTEQTVRVELREGAEGWFKLLGPAEQTLTIGPEEVKAVFFRLQAQQLGKHRLTVYGYGSQHSDAVSRAVEVVPDGRLVEETINDWLAGEVAKTVTVPPEAIEGAGTVLVKIYPGVFSQVVEGLDKILRMPYGCFEQTSSVTYPNVLVLQYLKRTGQATPELQLKAQEYIALGYQRLVSFEVPSGGFSWFGHPPANKMLTAYGLLEFSDLAKVYEVDPNLIPRVQRWLLAQRNHEGTWDADGYYLHTWSRLGNTRLLPTAYIVWALLESGCEVQEHGLTEALSALQRGLREVEDPYALALVANALLSAPGWEEAATQAVHRLLAQASETAEAAAWHTQVSTFTHAWGQRADVETTALATYALLRARSAPETASKALRYLIRAKDAYGTWGSTQATILALKALLKSVEVGTQPVEGTVTVLVNDEPVEALPITPEDDDVVRQVNLKGHLQPGANRVALRFEGAGSTLYQIVNRYYLPWTGEEAETTGPLRLHLSYERRELEKDDRLACTVTVRNASARPLYLIVLDLGLPPGFIVDQTDLTSLVEAGTIEKYTLTARQIIIYLARLAPKQRVTFTYHLRAKMPLRAKTPRSRAYLYYNPEIATVARPVGLTVRG
ncbi:MAG TPA: hypothetical protein EYP85_14795, partial [Armatimonadetes bacterium]|nr:hypothetical protein [Armatimonadota bacterium]